MFETCKSAKQPEMCIRDRAEASTSANLNHINKLQATVSTDYFDVTELENKVDNLLAGSGKKAFQQEQDYIWHLSLSLIHI